MNTDLVIVERELKARLPIFQQLLPPSVTPQRLMRTVVMSCERNPKLLDCGAQSLINAATTAAVLGLECDGVTGQGYIVPYWDSKKRMSVAQFQVGYKGYNTIGARANYTITGDVVREGDEFDYLLGVGGYVRHKPLLEGLKQRRIVAAWAVAEARGRPPIPAVMGIEEILQIKEKSMAAQKDNYSPWNDMNGPGFPAMCSKTVKRRLARSMPLSVMQAAAALETQTDDLGRAAYFEADGNLKVVGEATVAPGPVSEGTVQGGAQPEDLLSPVGEKPPPKFPSFSRITDWVTYSRSFLRDATIPEKLAWRDNFKDALDKHRKSRNEAVRIAANELWAASGGDKGP